MQTIAPVDVHVGNTWREALTNATTTKKSTNVNQRPTRQAPKMRTCVTAKTKVTKAKSHPTVQTIGQTKTTTTATSTVAATTAAVATGVPARSRSPSPPTRDPWVPPPGRSTKGQKFSWQGAKARLDIVPMPENLVNDVVDDEDSQRTARDQDPLNDQVNDLNGKFQDEIQTYEKRIHGLIEGVGMLKERARYQTNQDQLRADIKSSLTDLERSQQMISNESPLTRISHPSASSPVRLNQRSSSADERRTLRSTSKVSFDDDRRRARSTTPTRGPFILNPDRERLLLSLAQSEADIAQITKQLSDVKDTLARLKLDDQLVSYEVEQLSQQRNQLLQSIEHFESSNNILKEFLRHQHHLEAEHGILNEKNDSLLTRVHELENENGQIRRLLLDRENDNIALHTELERIRTHTIGFDTMKNSLEQNRAHLQRELYAKEGEINRLQCSLKSLERDLQRSRYQCESLQRSIKRNPMFPMSFSPTPPTVVPKGKGVTIEKLQAQLEARDHQIEELERKLFGNPNEQLVDANTEIVRLRAKLEHAERLVAEYKEQLHAQTLKTSANNSRTHLSEIELDKMRVRLQKRIEELEPLPELLRQAEIRNQDLQNQLLDKDKRLMEHAAMISDLTSKSNVHYHMIDRMKENHFAFDDDNRTLQQKIDSMQRQLMALEDENSTLLRNLNAKDEALRNTQTRLNAKTHEMTTINKQIDVIQTDLKAREETFNAKERFFQQRTSDLEQQLNRIRQEYTQSKREKEDLERRYTSQLGELRDKLEQSNNTNRSMQNYVNSLKTTYASVFNDPLPTAVPSLTSTGPFARFSTTPNLFP